MARADKNKYKLKEENIRVIAIPNLQRDISLVDEFRSFHFIFRTLMEERPALFHTNSSKMGGIGNLAARLAGVKKIIFTVHGWAFNEPRPWWQRTAITFFAWLTILFSHKTICVSDRTRKDISGWPFIKNKLVIIRNGIEKFELLPRSEARRELGIHEDDTLIVGTISELHPVKGLDTLLEAFGKFSRKNDGVLIMAGDGEIRENLEDFAEHLGIGNRVSFTGYIPDARRYLTAFDIFCLPSRSEAMPYALLEAGLAARSVIATKVGGIPEVVENGLSGALIEPDDSETLFSTLMLLSNDPELRKRLGTALKETVEEKFSLKQMFKKTIALY